MATVLVLCATGQQGRSVVKYLLAAGVKVHAVIRDAHSEQALRLKSQGVVLFEGDNDSFAVIREAASDCQGIYLNLQPSPTDQYSQQRQVHGIIQVCKETGLETIVLSTAYFTGDRSKWDNQHGKRSGVRQYYLAKAEMEKAVREAGVRHYTILRPAWFHANYLLPYSVWHFPGLSKSGELLHSYDEGVKMAHVDEDDIARYGVAALLNPAKFSGHEIDLGNENLTIQDAAETIRRVAGSDIQITVRKRTAEEVVEAVNLVATQTFQLWANGVDATIDGQQIQQKYGIRMTTFEEYLTREKDRLLESLPHTANS
jgi:uncharacterized protein YbjT (DUF2867 family)